MDLIKEIEKNQKKLLKIVHQSEELTKNMEVLMKQDELMTIKINMNLLNVSVQALYDEYLELIDKYKKKKPQK